MGAEYLAASHGFRMFGFGDAVRLAAREEYGLTKPTVGDLIRIGNEGRERSRDNGYWAGRLLEIIRSQGIHLAVVQGIRNPGEIECFRGQLNGRFVLLGVTAPLRLRAQRLLARGRSGDPTTMDQFMDLDDADRGIGQPEDGQRTDDCLALTSLANRFVNGGTLAEYHAWLDGRVGETLRLRQHGGF
jgi:hypothetical protein